MKHFIKRTKSVFNPNMYHGWNRTHRYFEGWYYKLIDASEQAAIAVIPGIAMDETGSKHAFIQILDGKKCTADYIKFSADEFSASSSGFDITIAANRFSEKHIILNNKNIKGELHFNDIVPWPRKWYSPGIMGPYSFIPFMECYHGIVSMHHGISGIMHYQDKELDFTGGVGYTEKDWGTSFPSAYFWMQSNHFDTPNSSVKASVARIPWLGSSFTGFIAGVWTAGTLYSFTTYNGTKLMKSYADAKNVTLEMENGKYHLTIHAQREESTELAAPIRGFMNGKIEESMNSFLEVTLIDKKTKRIIFKDLGRNSGLEVAGDISNILI